MAEIIDIYTFLVLLKQQYDLDPAAFTYSFKNLENGSVYRRIVENIAYSIMYDLQSASNSTIVQMDMDGDVLLANNEAEFSDTKSNVKKLNG